LELGQTLLKKVTMPNISAKIKRRARRPFARGDDLGRNIRNLAT
jgi:hypothetical protein